jgi:hypothetical protein
MAARSLCPGLSRIAAMTEGTFATSVAYVGAYADKPGHDAEA